MKENKVILYDDMLSVGFPFFQFEEEEWVPAIQSQMCPKGRYKITSRHENRVAYLINKLKTAQEGSLPEWADWLKSLQK